MTLLLAAAGLLLAADPLSESLWDAARKGDAAAVKALVGRKADVNAKTPYGATALSFAADKGHAEVVKLLLAAGADVNAADTFYQATPLTWAYARGHDAVQELLIDAGAKGADDLLTPAARGGKVGVVKAILAKTKPKQPKLDAALAAAAADQPEVAELLKAAGAKPPEKAAGKADGAELKELAGTYKREESEFTLSVKDGALSLKAGSAQLTLDPAGDSTFKIAGADAVVSFDREGGKITGLTVKSGSQTAKYKRVEASAAKPEPKAEPAPVAAEDTEPVTAPANWPQFRGVAATGVADGQHPPASFDLASGRNVRWKTPVPGLGHACPVVWGDRVFVATAAGGDPKAAVKSGQYGDVESVNDSTEHSWRLLCLDKHTGKVLWDREACRGVPKVKRHLKGTHANCTPATDGTRVVVCFGSEGLYCYDFDGNLAWKRDLGKLESGWFYDAAYEWGFGSSPAVWRDRVFLQCDVGKGSHLAAFALADGKELWRAERDEIPSWGSPTVVELGGRAEVVTNGTKAARGYDPETGKELWQVGKNSEITVPTPFAGAGLIFVASGYRPVQPIWAVKPGASGDVTPKDKKTEGEFVAWSKSSGGPYMPTPIVYGDHLYVLQNSGLLVCLDARTGKQVYRERVPGSGGYTASPVAADGRLYFVGEDGGVRVVKAGPKFELLSNNKLGETVLSTPAVSDGLLFVRTERHLVALGRPRP